MFYDANYRKPTRRQEVPVVKNMNQCSFDIPKSPPKQYMKLLSPESSRRPRTAGATCFSVPEGGKNVDQSEEAHSVAAQLGPVYRKLGELSDEVNIVRLSS